MIAPLSHPLAEKESLDLSEALPYKQILFTKKTGLRPLVDKLFKQTGHKPLVSYEVEEDQVIAGLVAENFGIAVIPKMHILDHLNIKTIKINNPSWERNFYMAKVKNRYTPPIVLEFEKYVLNNCSSFPLFDEF